MSFIFISLIILALAALIYFSFRGVNILYLAPMVSIGLLLATQLVMKMIGNLPDASGIENSFILYGITGSFMTSVIGYINALFLVFLVGAIYGKIMDASGASIAISQLIVKAFGHKWAMFAIVSATALLTYGGVSLFVVVFAIYPIASALFRELNIPRRLIPGAIALGAFTFTMTALPGTPQAINVLPTKMLGTNIYAGPILGLFGAAIMFGLGMLWLNYRSRTLAAEGFGPIPKAEEAEKVDRLLPTTWRALTPIVLIFILNYVFSKLIFARPDFLEMANVKSVDGQWTVILSLSIAIGISLWLFRKEMPNALATLGAGANDAVLPLFNTAAIIGFGGVVKSLSAFAVIKQSITSLSIAPIWKVAIATTTLSGVVGSSSGGTGLALETLGEEFLSYTQRFGIPAEVIHRVMLVAAGGLDSLPHCGAVVTLLMITRLTHKQSYLDIGIVTVAIPVIAVVAMILLYLATGVA